ncbi:MAG: PQQ-binding-like beta-propeller repeat protein [Verrucomicrobia bacterium]|jgi:outer membrane protein assembly factor BamB|nr:PQQ-binding-like beta-propeller repeat protein [Verrucomicrobiota bacterium]
MKCFFTAAAVVLAAAFFSTATAADWPRWRGPDLNGISQETGWSAKWPAGGPKQLWKASVGIGFSSVSVSQGRVYTSGHANNTDTVYCFDAKTGAPVWTFPYAAKLDPKYYEGGPSATPTADSDRIYMFSKRGLVLCLDAAKGGVIWSNNVMESLKAEMPTWGFASSVLVEGDACIVNAGAAGTAFNKKTGKVLWSSGTDAAGYSTPVPFDAGGERAVALCLKQDVAAIRVKDGKELWRYPWKASYDVNAADPIISGGKVFISAGYNRGGAVIDVSSGKPKPVWENKNMRNHFNSCVLLNGFLFGFDGDAGKATTTLKCLELATGEGKWSEKTGFGGLMAADGKLIVLTEKGELMVVEATSEKFKPISRAQVLGGKCWTTPVLANGQIFCRNAKGDLVCLDASGKR